VIKYLDVDSLKGHNYNVFNALAIIALSDIYVPVADKE
jgi:hypothetical protein